MKLSIFYFSIFALLQAAEPEIINGHPLPPEPDPKINNATLLGIDSNHNGVRDDVERWLIMKYKDSHKIVTEIALQTARAFQFTLAHPMKVEEDRKKINASQNCNFYFEDFANLFGDPILIDHDILNEEFEKIQLNTPERVKVYLAYDAQLSGGIYRFPQATEMKSYCDFNVSKLLKEK